MKKMSVLFFAALFSLFAWLSYSQNIKVPNSALINSNTPQIKSLDIDNDRKPEVIYHTDGKFVNQIDVDTNDNGQPDIIVYRKEGKFESAEVDTDHDGTMDKKFTDESQFKKWLNDTHPAYNKALDKQDWRFDLLDF